MTTFAELFWLQLRTPLEWFLDPAQRIYAPALLLSLVIAYGVHQQQKKRGIKSKAEGFFAGIVRRLRHPSAVVDVQLLFFNQLFYGLLVAPYLLAMGQVAVGFAAILSVICPIDALAWPPGLVLAFFSVTAFILEDASRWALHYALHRVPWLWAIHEVHHSAEELNPLTLYRMHPFEKVLFALRHIVALGLVTGLFFWMFRTRLSGWEILGVEAIGFLFNLAGSNLRHSHIYWSWGRWEGLFMSPAQHQIHHSSKEEHYDKNLGSFLSLWDRLAGTWLPAPVEEGGKEMVFGLGARRGHWSFRDCLFLAKGKVD